MNDCFIKVSKEFVFNKKIVFRVWPKNNLLKRIYYNNIPYICFNDNTMESIYAFCIKKDCISAYITVEDYFTKMYLLGKLI